ncbi:MAG: ATP-binding cassette domain-containing protein [Bilophila wadsworthia]
MGPSDRNVLEVQGLTVRFDTSERSVVAVKDLGFHVRAGEVLAIVGESGSGKSVTSLSVMRLIEHGGEPLPRGRSPSPAGTVENSIWPRPPTVSCALSGAAKFQ